MWDRWKPPRTDDRRQLSGRAPLWNPQLALVGRAAPDGRQHQPGGLGGELEVDRPPRWDEDTASGVIASGRPAKEPNLEPVASSSQHGCWFCGKARTQVDTLASGPAGEERKPPTICDECLGLSGEILSEQLRWAAPKHQP